MTANGTKRTILLAAFGALFGWAATAGAGNAADDVTFQSVPTFSLPGEVELDGAGLLWRTRDEIWANLSPSGLDPEHGYTVWWIIFNNPDNCNPESADPNVPGSPQCGPLDLGDPGVDTAIFYAGGFISGPDIDGDGSADGSPNASFHLRTGDVADGIDVLVEGQNAGGGNGLNRANGFSAEVHMIVRSHEPISAGSVDEQIGTFAGLCDAPGGCEDQQAVVFTANPPD